MFSYCVRKTGLVLLIAAISFSPRIPLPIVIPGRRFDLRSEDIILTALLLVWLLDLFLRPYIYWTPLFNAIGIYIATVFITTTIGILTFNLSPIRSLFYFLKEFEYFFIFLFVANWVHTKSDLKLAGGFLLFAGLLNAIWGGFQILTDTRGQLFLITWELPADVYQHPHLLESYGPTLIGEASPMATGGFFLLLFLLAFSYALFSRPSYWRWLCMVLSVIFFMNLFLSGSRASILAAIVGLVTLTTRTSRKIFGIIHILGVIILVVAVLTVSNKAGVHFSERFYPEAILHSFVFRLRNIWQPLLDHANDHFLLGSGKGALGFVQGIDTTEAHNHYLRVFLESGFFGVIAFVWLLIKITFLSANIHRNSEHAISKVISGTTLAATVALSVGALFQDIFVPVLLNELWWVLIGLTLAADRMERNSSVTSNGTESETPRPQGGAS